MKRITLTLIVLVVALMCSMCAMGQKAPKVIKLNTPTYTEGMGLMEALKNRKSSKGFTDKEIPLQDLSNLMWAAWIR